MLLLHALQGGGAMNLPTGELALPMEEAKNGFQGTINAKISEKIVFYFPKGAVSSGATPEAICK